MEYLSVEMPFKLRLEGLSLSRPRDMGNKGKILKVLILKAGRDMVTQSLPCTTGRNIWKFLGSNLTVCIRSLQNVQFWIQ